MGVLHKRGMKKVPQPNAGMIVVYWA